MKTAGGLSLSTANKTRLKPFEPQKVFIDPHDKSKRYYGYVSGVGAGKTFAGIIRTIHNLREWNSGEMGAIIAPTRQMIVNVIIPEMRSLGLFDPPINWEYKSAYSDEPGIHTPEGSRALMLSADNSKTVERLRGLNLSWVWIDERTAVPERAQQIAMQRLRVGEYRNLYVTTTPKGKDDVYDFFVDHDDAESRELEHGTVYETDDRLAVVGVPTSANPHTPEDYSDAMDQDMPDEIRAQEVEGRFIEVGGGVYKQDMIHWVQPDEISDNVKAIIGVDPAATSDSQRAQEQDSDYWALTVAYWNTTDSTLYVADTAERRGMTLREGIDFIRRVAAQVESPQIVVEANAAQQYLVDELSHKGMNTVPVNTSRNKEDKLIDMSIPISNGSVKFIDWRENETDPVPYQDLRDQMLGFPEAAHDDLLDSLALVVNHAPTGTSIFGGSYKDGDL